MQRVVLVVSGIATVIFLWVAVRLAAHERGGPPHVDIELDGGIPATFTLPGEGPDRSAFAIPKPREARPPAVALMHGIASDRAVLTTLSRRLAHAGYAVLSFDARGHGRNRNPMPRGFGRSDRFGADFAAAVDFLRTSPFVDGSRIAVMGHSMGAGAALDYATRESGLDAAVLISGGWSTLGPYAPPNALFIYAEGDSERMKRRSDAIAARLAGVDPIVHDRLYGDVAHASGVKVVEVANTDHTMIVATARAAAAIIDWLDVVFAHPDRELDVLADPRQALGVTAGLLLLLMLPGLGIVVGRIVEPVAKRPASGGGFGLLTLAIAMVATAPLVANGPPTALLPFDLGDVVIVQLLLTGLAVLTALAVRGELDLGAVFRGPAKLASGALLSTVAAYVLLQPLGIIAHSMALTPERVIGFVLAALGLLPFSLAFQILLRRGSSAVACGFALAGRVLVIAALIAGVSAGVFSGVIALMIPAFAIAFLIFESLAFTIYATSGNLATIAVAEAAWVALIVASIMPMRI